MGSPSTTLFVVLTSYAEDEYLLPALQAGALGYLLKDVEPEELVGAIRAAGRGHATLHPGLPRGWSVARNTPAMTHGPLNSSGG